VRQHANPVVVPALVAALATTACAIRAPGADRYVGPVLYRETPRCRPDGTVVQTAHVGLLVEAGTQWGMSVGLADRVAVAPAPEAGRDCPPPGNGRATALAIPLGTGPDRWHLSPVYLLRSTASPPLFVRRRGLGVRAGLGVEARTLSVGAVSTTVFTPPPDAFSTLSFSGGAPLRARLHVWRELPADGGARILEEVER
jgi:hypothetical protein